MKYEYEPSLLKAWVKENKEFLKKEMENLNEKYKSRLDRMKEELTVHAHNPSIFVKWVESLPKKEKILLPNLYDEALPDQIKKIMVLQMKATAQKERRLFRVMTDVVYNTANFDELWDVLKMTYASHQERIERRMDDKNIPNWRGFIRTDDPILFLSSTSLKSEKSILEELETFYLTKGFPVFKLVLMEIFGKADETLFQDEEGLFKELFKESKNKDQQKLANDLIHACKLNNVKPIGKLIFEKLKIYTRRPMLWEYVGEEEKKRFARWIMKQEIKNFFGGVNQHHERFIYWEKFIHKLEDVVVTDQQSTLIMYFSDVVIMEVLGTGAVYIYKKKDFEKNFQKKIDEMLEERERLQLSFREPRDVKRIALMDQYLSKGRLIHRLGWQRNFDNWLQHHLRWEVNRDVLQEEAKRDEGVESGS